MTVYKPEMLLCIVSKERRVDRSDTGTLRDFLGTLSFEVNEVCSVRLNCEELASNESPTVRKPCFVND